MKLDARGLPLPLPDIIVGIEDSVPEKIPERVAEIRAFRVRLEPRLEKVFEVTGVGSDYTVEICKPRAPECESNVLPTKNLRNPFVHIDTKPENQ